MATELKPSTREGVASGDSNWDRFLDSQSDAHILQSNEWGVLKSDFGWQSETVILERAGAIQSGAQVLYRSLLGARMAYVPKGPLVDWRDETRVSDLFERIAFQARRRRSFLLKIEPDLCDSVDNRNRLASLGFRPSPQTIQPRSTVLLDIEDDTDAILARMKSKWRYNIRLAGRKGVTVREGKLRDLDHFESLMAETGNRNDFSAHSIAYYRRAFELFIPHRGVFLFAEYQGEPLAAIVVLTLGRRAWYLWGASSNRERNRMPNHALQWAAMEWARDRGCTEYDFWGIPDEIGAIAWGMGLHRGQTIAAGDVPVDLGSFPQGDLWGVFRFKQGFGGRVVRHVGAWDLPLLPFSTKIYDLGLGLQAWQRRRDQVQGGVSEAGAARPTAHRHEDVIPSAEPIPDLSSWRATLERFENPHVLQSWEWGELKEQTGWRVRRRLLRNRSAEIESAYQLLWRQPLPMVPLRVAYVPKGPLTDWSNEVGVDRLLNAIETECRRLRCLFVKIDPDMDLETLAGKRALHRMRSRGWRPSPEQVQFANTAYTDLNRSADDLLASFKSKWRYNIRLAERRGVTVRLGDETDLALFYHLYQETGERDGFLVRPFAYYETIWTRLLQAQRDRENPLGGALFLAEHPDEPAPLAGLFLFVYAGQAWYFYGASSDRRRRDMPNYLLQWRAMTWAQEIGCRRYDWWGAPTSPDDETDPLAGVWRFKQGFDAELARHAGAWDWSPNPVLWRVYHELMPRLLDRLRKGR